jgi:hypothetical protein
LEFFLTGSGCPPAAQSARVRGHFLELEVAEQGTTCASLAALYAVVVTLNAPVLQPNAYSSVTTVVVTEGGRTTQYPLLWRG